MKRQAVGGLGSSGSLQLLASTAVVYRKSILSDVGLLRDRPGDNVVARQYPKYRAIGRVFGRMAALGSIEY